MLSEKEYAERKRLERKWADDFIATINNSDDPLVRFKDSRPITDIRDLLVSSCALYGDHTAFWVKEKRGGEYVPITYNTLLEDVNGLGTALIAAGLKDKRIGVIGENCYQWATGYLAVMCGTGIVVPLDKELSKKEIRQLLEQAETSAVICDKKHEEMFTEIMDEGGTELKLVIGMNAEEDTDKIKSWRGMVEAGKKLVLAGDRSFIDAQVLNDVMSVLLFTSGTTGIAKGVMVSHKNIAADLMTAPTIFPLDDKQIFFSFLPLHHTYECTCGFLMPLYKGTAIAYCEGLKYIVKNLSEIHPTYFLGVPALFENLHKKIWQNARKQGKEEALKKAIKINNFTKKFGVDLSKKLFKDIHALFGGRMKVMIVGGGAINPAVLDDLKAFGFMALQGYGLTEAAPMGALNPYYLSKSASIGRRFPNTDIRIDNPGEDGNGEICIKGDNIMLGYYNRPDLTEEVIKDGWFYTGDLGYLDEDGFAYITGRKKNVIITKNGKNVYPEELEYYLSSIELVGESMVWEKPSEIDDDTTIVASIYPNPEVVKEMFGDNTPTDEELLKVLWEEVDKINEDVPLYKRIKSIIIRHEEFEKNSSKKIKRFVAANKEA